MSQTHYVLCLYLLISKNVLLPIWTLGTTSFGAILMKMYSFIVFALFSRKLSRRRNASWCELQHTLCACRGCARRMPYQCAGICAGYHFLRGWCCLRIIYESAVNFEDVYFELCLLCLHCFPPCLLSFFFSPVNLLEILKGFKSIPPSSLPHPSIPLSLPHTHFSLLAATRFEKIAVYFDPQCGWRPHLVAAGNSISLPHTDEWVTTFRAPVNMCLMW